MYWNIKQFPELKGLNAKQRRAVLVPFVQRSRAVNWASMLTLVSPIASFFAVRALMPGYDDQVRIGVSMVLAILLGYAPYLYLLNGRVRRDFEREYPAIRQGIEQAESAQA